MKLDVFNKMGPCMINDRTAVCLVPQCFHNTIHPDALDAQNGDFMFGKLPFYFGAGVLFVTGAASQHCTFLTARFMARLLLFGWRR